MIRMVGVDEGRFDISELKDLLQADRPLETARKFACLLGEVITVETVEPDVVIPLPCEKRLPCWPRCRKRVRCKRLRHYHLRSKALPVAVQQHLLLSAFDVHL